MLVAARRNAQPGAAHQGGGTLAHVLHVQRLGVEAARIPVRHFQAQGAAQQRLAGAQLVRRTRARRVGIERLHARQRLWPRTRVDPGMTGLDQHRVARPGGAEVQRVAAARVVHVDDAAVHEQRAPLVGIAQRGVAALLGLVVGLGLDDAGRQPQAVDAMPDHLAQEVARQLAGVAVETSAAPRRCPMELPCRPWRCAIRRSVRRSAFAETDRDLAVRRDRDRAAHQRRVLGDQLGPLRVGAGGLALVRQRAPGHGRAVDQLFPAAHLAGPGLERGGSHRMIAVVDEIMRDAMRAQPVARLDAGAALAQAIQSR